MVEYTHLREYQYTKNREHAFACAVLRQAMIDGWEKRLIGAIERYQARSGVADYVISKEAGLGQNFVGQLKKGRASPKLDALAKLAGIVDVSLMAILFGRDISKDEEDFLLAFRRIGDAEGRKAYLQVLRGMSVNKESGEPAGDSPGIVPDKEPAPR